MLARAGSFRHRLGGTVDLPLLVPSFTSKGFRTYRPADQTTPLSQVNRALEIVGGSLQESLLLSAYDLHHGHFDRPERHFAAASLVFIDSGGYELSPVPDAFDGRYFEYRPKEFSLDDYVAVLRRLTRIEPPLPLAITNFDSATRNTPILEQIDAAQSLFEQFPRCAHIFLLKPHTETGSRIHVDEVLANAQRLHPFDAIGLTEDELGKNLLEKLNLVGGIRLALDDAGIQSPIHIFGGLDPLTTPLFFFAGAQIFDGVSWLHYSYHGGHAVRPEAYGVLELGIESPLDHVLGLSCDNNIAVLRRLATALREFALDDSRDFAVFGENEGVFKKAYGTMSAKIRALGRG